MATTNKALQEKVAQLQKALELSNQEMRHAYGQCIIKNCTIDDLAEEIWDLKEQLDRPITLRNWLKLLPLAVRQSCKR